MRETRSAYWLDPTAHEAINNLHHISPHHVSPTTQQLAYQLAEEIFPDRNLLTRKQFAEIQEDCRGRRRAIQSLQERLLNASGEEYLELVGQLKQLEARQFAAKIATREFRGR